MTQSTTEFVNRIDADPADPGPARISGGHLVAKALKAEGVDTIFTLTIAPALQRARESGLPSLINVWINPDV